jgi:hypothetical protein
MRRRAIVCLTGLSVKTRPVADPPDGSFPMVNNNAATLGGPAIEQIAYAPRTGGPSTAERCGASVDSAPRRRSAPNPSPFKLPSARGRGKMLA